MALTVPRRARGGVSCKISEQPDPRSARQAGACAAQRRHPMHQNCSAPSLSQPVARHAGPWQVLRARWCRVATLATTLACAGFLAGCASLPASAERTPSSAPANTSDTPLGKVLAPRLAQHPGDSLFYPLSSGPDALAARLAMRARRSAAWTCRPISSSPPALARPYSATSSTPPTAACACACCWTTCIPVDWTRCCRPSTPIQISKSGCSTRSPTVVRAGWKRYGASAGWTAACTTSR